jgi:lipopolysaccharide export system permease protein
MQILTRYILSEFFKTFLLALSGMTIFMLLMGVATEALREGLSLGPILRILPFIVPESMRFSIPASALLSTCVVFGRMSGENEITAIKAAGGTPWVALAPVFIASFLISVAALWINDLAVSWGRPGITQVIVSSIEQIAYGVLRTNNAYSREGLSITVRSVDGRRLIRPVITLPGHDGDAPMTIAAREAELRSNADRESLTVLLTDASVEGPNGLEAAVAGTVEREISLHRKDQQTSVSDFPLWELSRERTAETAKIGQLEGELSAEAALHLFNGELEAVQGDSWKAREGELGVSRYRLRRLETEPWRRWANSFSCLCFVMVGAPRAIRMRHSDFVTTFFLTFLPILIVYYPIMAYGVDCAKDGVLPQYATWLGNFACILWGIVSIRKVCRG